jgi:hypothetical protein
MTSSFFDLLGRLVKADVNGTTALFRIGAFFQYQAIQKA